VRLINMTAFPVVVRASDGTDTAYPPCGVAATVLYKTVQLLNFDGIPVPIAQCGKGEILYLFPSAPETLYIVSLPVALAAYPARKDLIYPGILAEDKPIRDAIGKVVAVTRFRAPC